MLEMLEKSHNNKALPVFPIGNKPTRLFGYLEDSLFAVILGCF